MTLHVSTSAMIASAAPVRAPDDLRSAAPLGCLVASFEDDCLSSPDEVRRLVEARPDLAVVVVAWKPEVTAQDAIEIMKAGAFDLVLEPVSPRALDARLAAAAQEGRRRAARCEARAAARERLDRLTRRERDVVRELIDGATNKLAARHLALSPRTVEIHRARIFEKLGVAGVAELTRLALTAEWQAPA